MTSTTSSQAQAGQAKRTSFGGFPGGGASIFLDRSKAGFRGSTPDSEALASSDDEQDHHLRLHPVTSNPGPKPVRRLSWLTDMQQVPNRKGSLGGNGPFAPASPNTTASPNDQTPWGGNVASSTGSTIGRGHATSTSFPWGNPIWNNDPQKGPPQRLTEVLPSPTSMVSPGSTSLYTEEPLHSPPLSQENMADSAIPFAIPLQPTLKTYRSQSYSVGQLDPESSNLPSNSYGGYNAYGRSRNGAPYAGLQHRPSRPSMLGDLSHDPPLLEQLREVEDDEESSNGSETDVQLSAQETKIQQLATENAMLRQAAAERSESAKLRNRAATSITSKALRSSAQVYSQHSRDPLAEETEYALYDFEDPETPKLYKYESVNGRRSSEYATKSSPHYTVAGIPENRTLESVKKGHWQSSLGFGGMGEPPQSRRHSFADVPTRQNSIGSAGDSQNGHSAGDIGLRSNGRHGSPGGYSDALARPSQGDGSECTHFHSPQIMQERYLGLEHLRDRNFAVAYFSRRDPSVRSGEGHGSAVNHHQEYMQSQYGRSQHLGHLQARPSQLLYIVTFKAQRADVFYVQEGTGLQVKKGDLVIVEADRGADLGTVASNNVPFAEAKELKDRYMQEHYNWLMVFSRHGQDGTVAGPNPNGQPNTSNSAIEGMSGSPGQVGPQDLPNSELKPKMIKRLAQPHEIQTLRDKEGNEAKAKRVCQQKVVEHRLNMEILEAEFQMWVVSEICHGLGLMPFRDWKKLTFYYFADEYINFNSLVTDLFKIYKTRIWMSAINPASFQTPAGGLQLPGGIGSSVFSADTDQYSNRHPQRQYPMSTSSGPNQAPLGAFDHAWSASRDNATVGPIAFPQLYAQPFPSHDLDVRSLDQYPIEYRQGLHQVLNIHSPFNSPGYNAPNPHHSSSFTARPQSGNGGIQASHVFGRDWNQSFQGLSLNP